MLHEQLNWVTDKSSSAPQAPLGLGDELIHAVIRTLLADGSVALSVTGSLLTYPYMTWLIFTVLRIRFRRRIGKI
jgi:hypothetical protein